MNFQRKLEKKIFFFSFLFFSLLFWGSVGQGKIFEFSNFGKFSKNEILSIQKPALEKSILLNKNKIRNFEVNQNKTNQLKMGDDEVEKNHKNNKIKMDKSGTESSFFDFNFFHYLKNPFLNPKKKGWFYIFFIVFLAGVMTSFTPCVFPMIPITLSVIGMKKTNSKKESFVLSSIYVLGIALTYSSMGLLVSFTGSLFGSFLGHPGVGIFFALIFVLLALSLFGFFEIQMPKWVHQKVNQYSLYLNKKKMSWVIVFLSGILAGVIASPCVGPWLAALLLYVAKIQDPIFGFFLLFIFSLGLGQLFLFLGVFSQKTLPKLGVWMKRIQYLLGIFLLFFAFNFVTPFLKETSLKEKNLIHLNGNSVQNNKEGSTGKNLYKYKKNVIYGYQWVLFSKKALEQAKKDQKPVIIDVYASWCIACVRLEKKTFKDPKVREFGQDFLWLKLDVTKMSKKKKEILKEFDVFGLPTLLFFDSKGNKRKDLTLRGFEKPAPFIQRMKKLTLVSSDQS